MAINFPPQTVGGAKPLDGTTWAAPNGQQWQYDAVIDAWRALGTPSGSGVTYRGPIDLTQTPAAQYTNIVAGDFFVVEVGDNPVSSAYPGLTGDEVLKGMEVIFDGLNYAAIGNLVPYATTTIAGKIEIATQQEVDEGTNTQTAVTPATLHDWADNEYQPILPTGSDGLFLGHASGSPAWLDLPKATEQVEGITKYAQVVDLPDYTTMYSYYSNGGTYPNPANANFSESLAVTPFSLAPLVDLFVAQDQSISKYVITHVGQGGQPTFPNGDLATHPIVTDTDAGFMSPQQKQDLETAQGDITTIEGDITTINNTLTDLQDQIDTLGVPALGEVGDLVYAVCRAIPEQDFDYGDTIVLSQAFPVLYPTDGPQQIPGLGSLTGTPIESGTWQCLGICSRPKRIDDPNAGPPPYDYYELYGATLWRRIA